MPLGVCHLSLEDTLWLLNLFTSLAFYITQEILLERNGDTPETINLESLSLTTRIKSSFPKTLRVLNFTPWQATQPVHRSWCSPILQRPKLSRRIWNWDCGIWKTIMTHLRLITGVNLVQMFSCFTCKTLNWFPIGHRRSKQVRVQVSVSLPLPPSYST